MYGLNTIILCLGSELQRLNLAHVLLAKMATNMRTPCIWACVERSGLDAGTTYGGVSGKQCECVD